MRKSEMFEAKAFQRRSGDFWWAVRRDGVAVSGGAGYASLEEAQDAAADMVLSYVGERKIVGSWGWGDGVDESGWVDEYAVRDVVV